MVNHFNSQLSVYEVQVHLDHETRDVVIAVPAKSFDRAAKQALNFPSGLEFWEVCVNRVTRIALID